MRRALVLGMLVPLVGGGMAEANARYRSGQFAAAASAYQQRYANGDTSAVLRYNLGTALLRVGRWDEARPHLDAAAGVQNQPELRQRALYNAGNADLEPVFEQKVSDPDQRRERLLRAIARYKDALLATPGDLDAKWNLELAERLLRNQPPRSGGGGGGGAQQQSGGGGGAAGPQQSPQQGESQPQPRPEVSESKADSILMGAAAAEQDAQREVLSRARGEPKVVRDW